MEDDFPFWCIEGCSAAMTHSGNRVLRFKCNAVVKYKLWTCPRCGNTVRVRMWNRRIKDDKV